MKKKILYLIILGFIALGPNYVKADKVCGGTLSLRGSNESYWNITLNPTGGGGGTKVYCLDPGKKARTGGQCVYGRPATPDESRGLNVDTSSLSVRAADSIQRITNQGILSEATAVEELRSTYGLTTSRAIASNLINQYNSAQPSSGASVYYCSGDTTGKVYQRMLVPNSYPCREEEPAACPNGIMSLNQGNTSCDQTLNGIENDYYSYTATSGSLSYVHQTYGMDQNAPATGDYCKLFCNEFGKSTLPGALVDALQLGSYAIWPTSKENQTNKFTENSYPLKLSGHKECKLVLMPDHGNFPGTGCNEDPVAEYVCLYNGSSIAGSKYVCDRSGGNTTLVVRGATKDYSGVQSYENVRIANRNYFNEPSYCGTPKEANGSVACRKGAFTKYKITETSQYYNSGSRYTYYDKLIKDIDEKAKAAGEACEAFTPEVEAMANRYDMCDVTNAQGIVIGRDLCDDIKDARSIRSSYESAVSAYDSAVNATASIETSITICEDYIKDFNRARLILHEIGLCGNFSVGNANTYYQFDSTASYSFTSGKYNDLGGALEQEVPASYGCSGQCDGMNFNIKDNYLTLSMLDTPGILAGKVSQIENRDITLTATDVVYKSTSNYSYINKKTNDYSKIKLNQNFLEILTKNGDLARVLPTDYNVPIINSENNALQYELRLLGVHFGEDMKFSVNGGNDYICKYEVTKKPDGCECPPDTKMAGKDLMYQVINDPISCADAQEKYCDSGEEKEYDPYCPDKSTPLTGCLKTGIGKEKCIQLLCTDTYKCKNTNGLRTGMDITDCVQTKRAQELTVKQALDYCDSVVCPLGKFIIYRTIRLENPFPGKEISKIAPGFNNDVIGRYPGTNWNGKELVKKKIRNNRSTSGTTIYNKKEPLYSFTLTGTTIKSIRDYNDKQTEGYNDFKLSCNKNNSAACISSFVHDARYGLVSGKCVDVDNRSGSFYTCMNN